MRCDLCESKGCSGDAPCTARDSLQLYSDPDDDKMMKVAAAVRGFV